LPNDAGTELVFVVDVSSFTQDGFQGSSIYSGQRIAIEFDAGDKGLYLRREMAQRLGVRKGSRVSASVEAEKDQTVQLAVAGVGSELRISDAKVYYAIGREGGAVIRLRSY